VRVRAGLLAAVLVASAVLAAVLLRGDGPAPGVPLVPAAPDSEAVAVPDPFAYEPAREVDFVRRAAAGTSHVLYARSPGGATATAARVARWRPLVERAAASAHVDPDLLEALVFLESAGRPDAQAGDLEGAVGLTQILAETGQSLLGMRVDVPRSRRLGRRIERALRAGHPAQAERLRRARAQADERFDPVKALAGSARYLTIAREELGRQDLAFVSYHMGIGNLQGVLRAYGEKEPSYARVYFDSTPTHHADVQRRLAAFGDDSATYLWRLYAAREIMRLYRREPAELARREALQTAKNSAEELLHPVGETPRFMTPKALYSAWDEGAIRAFPNKPAVTGLARDPRMGELAGRLGQPPALYRGLRPEALALALYAGALTREYAGGQTPLMVTSTVRDAAYQRELLRRNREATRNFSLHTTGWAFDVARAYRSPRQARAFQFVLDRLQVLDIIAWVREPSAIHITAGQDAKALLPLLGRLG
jgi:soluble lytic murein transglycosylase-like protein